MYLGSPNVTVTAIDTGGGIACSRTSGQVPCFVQVSASAITATGPAIPYEELDYRWDFGDPTGTELFTRPTDGAQVNANSAQKGPEAAYCYRTAGTYTVTLYIRGKNGGGFTSASVTQDITVSAFNKTGGEYWADSTAVGSTDAGTLANPFITMAAINSAIGSGSNKALHFKRGSDFVGSTGLLCVVAAGLRVDDYGSGAKPIINVSSGSTGACTGTGGGSTPPGSPKSDWVFTNIDFKSSGTATGSVISITNPNTVGTLSDIYFDNCSTEALTNPNGVVIGNAYPETPTSWNFGFWNCAFTMPLGDASGGSHIQGFYGGPASWFFMIGVTVIGDSRASNIFDHHAYLQTRYHGLYRWMNFPTASNRSYCFNTNYDRAGVSLEYAEYHCFDEINLSGTQYGFDASNGTNDAAKSRFRNMVISGNVTRLKAGAILFSGAETVTIRDNRDIDTPNFFFAPGSNLAAILKSKTYRNRLYKAAGAPAALTKLIEFNPSVTWTQAHEFTDNVIQDMRGPTNPVRATVVLMPFASFPSNGSIVDRNQYYYPNDTDALNNGSSRVSFSAWQAQGLDTNGSNADPGWPDPASGVFDDGKRTVSITT